MIADEMKQKVAEVVNKFNCEKAQLINIMQAIQKEYRYLPEDAMILIAEMLDLSQSKVYGVATFYENFSLEPKGENVIKICDGTACHVRKSTRILDAMRKELKLSEEKHTTDDMKFTLETVSCLGACGLAPVITINDKVFPKMTPELAVELINKIKMGEKI
ncbi:NADH-quinone oxidoreductase subunit NuoE [Sedimentibacter sp. zth1]|uniref:NADH-quinone oxidoreductase subunit NuoE n=1 Tax=Sedimentibacter sp. zth1 TaxID=2816908 RepID=UPI001A90D2B7|nr:NADH-quinone oxidoreductase subunit NuoE [Sedimentibacter sp. zth1]QSX06798.1 NADH-quinone oxidoreductase subunit NuoE [Sedimentibacter sp. zth1]